MTTREPLNGPNDLFAFNKNYNILSQTPIARGLVETSGTASQGLAKHSVTKPTTTATAGAAAGKAQQRTATRTNNSNNSNIDNNERCFVSSKY